MLTILTIYWHRLDTSELPIRMVVWACFVFGTALVATPAILTAAQVTLLTLRYLSLL